MTSNEETAACRGRLLPDHLRLDPHARPLRPVKTPGLDLVGPTLGARGAFWSDRRAAGIGTAVTLYPRVKRQNEGFALGFVTARVLEAAMIVHRVISLLSLVTLHRTGGTPSQMRLPVIHCASRVAI